MKMGLILHPGHPKCGSSSIQKFLFDRRIDLESNGYAVPDRFFHFRFERDCDFSIALAPVLYLSEIMEQGNYSLIEKRIRNAIENAQKSDIHTFILSAESLSSLHAVRIHELFSKYFEIKKVLYYIRRQDDLLLSAWQQWGHKSGTGFAEYCNQQLKNGQPMYTRNAQILESHYGKDKLEVAPFSRKAFYNGDLISDFLVRTGLDALIDLKSVSDVENERLNPLVCDYLAQFSYIYTSAHDNRPKNNLEKYKSSEPWLFDSGKDYLNATLRKSILKHFEVENRKLHSEYFPSISYDLIFGGSITTQNDALEQSSKELDKHQLDFLKHWVGKWYRFKKLRNYFISIETFFLTIKRHLFRSK